MIRKNRMPFALALLLSVGNLVPAQEPNAFVRQPHWEVKKLSPLFYSEGGTVADVDGDGAQDIIAGPRIYFGPDFVSTAELQESKPYNINGYSDYFFVFDADIDKDGDTDILVQGFPGAAAHWFRNPGKEKARLGKWERFVAMDIVDNESPCFADINGDSKPDLICCSAGKCGYIEIADDPTQKWTFRPVSAPGPYERFTHGIGIGDVNDDGRIDLMAKNGWWEQPETITDAEWKFHAFEFSAAGGAQMYAIDLDGDKRTEVITSLAAHSYGLCVYKKTNADSADAWTRIDIMTDKAESSPTGLAISQLHAIAMADMDGDGQLDIVTGKRFWAHNGHDPGENEPVLLVWFKPTPTKAGLRFAANLIDDNSGVGTQVVCRDINHDGKLDVLSASKRGVHLLLQSNQRNATNPNTNTSIATNVVALNDSPRGFVPVKSDGSRLNLDFESGQLLDWTSTGAAFFNQPVKGDTISIRSKDVKSNHHGEYWIGSSEITTDVATGTLTSSPFAVSKPWCSFLFAGGSAKECRIEIVDFASGEILKSVSGNNEDTLRRVSLECNAWIGKSIQIRLVDESRESWGHVNFDDFRFHDSDKF